MLEIMRRIRLAVYLILIALPSLYLSAADDGPAPKAVVLTISGPIGPATADYVKQGLEEAQQGTTQLVVLAMDTPGGLDTAMRDIIQYIIASPVPVVTYVSPSGARAASAGTYILYASHVAAMAPATTLGAATPVRIGGTPGAPPTPYPPDKGGRPKPDTEDDQSDEQPESEKSPDVMERKIINDAAAYIRGLAQMRGRNVEWAEKAVRESASLSAEEALAMDVVDLVTRDLPDLLAKLDGWELNILGQERKLDTAGIVVETLEPGWRSRLLSVITDPNILPILMTLGVFGLMYEMLNPGFVLPGVLGGICLLLALYAAQVLPVNYAGLALMILGLAFMVGEAFMPSFGALGIGGAIAFVIGSIILIDTEFEGYGVSVPFIVALGLMNIVLFAGVATMAMRSRRKPVVSGKEELVGSVGEVISAADETGRARVHSEDWQVRSQTPIRPGQKVRVTAVDGLTLVVEPLQADRESSI